MGKNNKPILSVLVDEDKKERFADLARRNKQSMGWVLNACIDRMLAADSIDLCRGSIGDAATAPKPAKAGLSVADVEELIKAYADSYIAASSIGIDDVREMVRVSIEPVKTELLETVKVSIGNIPASSIDINDIQKMVNESIEVALEPIEAEVAALKKSSDRINLLSVAPQTKPQQPAKSNQTRKPSEVELPTLQAVIDMELTSISWGQFMRLVGLDPDEPKKASNAGLALEIAAGMGIPVSPKGSSKVGYYFTPNKGFAVRKP
jgi:hypothetical protein